MDRPTPAPARPGLSIEAFCRPEGSDLAWLGEVREVTAATLCLHVSRRFELEQTLVVELPELPDGTRRELTVRVRRVFADPSGKHWALDCAVTGEGLTPEQRDALERQGCAVSAGP